MRPVDEIGLVYRFVRGERVPQLAALFQLSESYTYLLIHNGTWLLAIFWGSLYYRRWNLDELRVICAPASQHAQYLPATAAPEQPLVITVAGDCTESVISSYDDLQLSKVVYSEKQEAPTLKIFFVCSLNRFVLLRSAVYGGSATERAPAEAVLESEEWNRLFDPVQDLTLTLDRGFAYGSKVRLNPVPLRKGHKWLPAFLNKETKAFTLQQVADNMVSFLIPRCA